MAKSPAPSAQTLGHYVLRKKLGAGAMGQVWLAHDKLLDREVAVKVLHAGMSDKRLVQDFLREAQAAAKLNHPNTVTIYQIGKQGDKVFIAMEYVEAGSLSDELRDKGALPWREATQAIRDAAAGLQAAHERGMVHRDIKPSNLMRSARGLVKVVDFGLAKTRTADSEATQTQAGTLLGSPAYMSPEQCRGERADARSDLYSLICSYYQLLTRQTPFAAPELTAAMYQHCHEPFPDVRAKVKVPDSVCRILEKGSRKKPDERYQTAGELIANLDTILHTPEVSHTFDKGATIPRRTKTIQLPAAGSIERPKRILPMAIGALFVAGIAGGIIFWLLHHHGPSATGSLAQTPSDAVAKPAVAAAPRVVDVLQLVDVTKDAQGGTWARDGRALVAGPNHSVLQIPYCPPSEYDYRVIFSPTTDAGDGIDLILSKGSRTFGFILSTANYHDLFFNIKGHDVNWGENPTRLRSLVRPVRGQKYNLEVKVRNDGVKAFLDGQFITGYKTDYSDLWNGFSPCSGIRSGSLGLATYDAPAKIYSAEVVEVSGSGNALAPMPVMDLMPLIDLVHDVEGDGWKKSGGQLISSGPGHRILGIPVEPPEEYDLVVEFTPSGHEYEMSQLLTHDGHRFCWTLRDWDGNTVMGFDSIAGNSYLNNPTTFRMNGDLKENTRHALSIHVRNSVVWGLLDGKYISHYVTNFSDLQPSSDWTLGHGGIGLMNHFGDVVYDKLEIAEFTGKAQVIRREVQSPLLIRSWRGEVHWDEDFRFTPDGRRLYVLPTRSAIYDVSTGASLLDRGTGLGRFSPDGSLEACFHTANIELWSVSPPALIRPLTGDADHPDPVAACFTPDGRFVAVCWHKGFNNLLQVYDVKSGAVLGSTTDVSGIVEPSSLAISPYGRFLIAGTDERNVSCWELNGFKKRWVTRFDAGQGAMLSHSKDGSRLIATGAGVTNVLDARDGKPLYSAKGQLGNCWPKLSPDGRFLLTPGDDGPRLHDVNHRAEIPRFSAKGAPAWSVALSEDGNLALAGRVDGSTDLFDVPTGKLLQHYGGVGGRVMSCNFSPDGKTFVSASQDTTIRIYRLPEGVGQPATSSIGGGQTPTREILFDGKNLNKWQRKGGGPPEFLLGDGYMETAGGDIETTEKFQDFRLHVEFSPQDAGPDVHGQGRGNSGVFLQGRYEIQVLDSYGVADFGDDDCGAIYKKKAPMKNMSLRPGEWQSYDMEFHPARFEGGTKISPATVTLFWNGTRVLDSATIDTPTLGGAAETPEPGPIRLQKFRGNARFRNIWIEPLTPTNGAR